MKFAAFIIGVMFVCSASLPAQHLTGKTRLAGSRTEKRRDKQEAKRAERTVAAEATVAVSVCIASGDISVRGWERNEVRARSKDASEIELRRRDTTDVSKPAQKLELFVSDEPEESHMRRSCQVSSDLELNVPRGATVQVQTRDGNISVIDVAAAYVNTQGGDISIERISRAVEAGSMGGSISLKDSKGRINLHAAGGCVEAIGVLPVESDDIFDASTISGDITLKRVGHAQLNARTVSGSVDMAGPLAHGGRYGFKTLSGDVTLTLPADASFQLSAKISDKSDIITDFPLTLLTEDIYGPESPVAPAPTAAPAPGPAPAPGKDKTPKPGTGPKKVVVITGPTVAPNVVVTVPPYNLRRLNYRYGNGDAVIYLASFSGTLHLEKK